MGIEQKPSKHCIHNVIKVVATSYKLPRLSVKNTVNLLIRDRGIGMAFCKW